MQMNSQSNQMQKARILRPDGKLTDDEERTNSIRLETSVSHFGSSAVAAAVSPCSSWQIEQSGPVTATGELTRN